MRNGIRRAGFGLVVLFAAACSPSAPQAQPGQAQQQQAAPGGSQPTQGQPTGPISGATVGPSLAPSGSATSTATQPPARTAGTLPTVATRDTSPVRVGVLSASAAPVLLGSAVTTGDTQTQAAAVFEWLNTHGGMAGRRVSPLYYAIPADDAASDPGAAQLAGCDALAEVRAQFVVSVLALLPDTLACFARAGMTVLDDAGGPTTLSPEVARYVYAPGSFSTERLMRELVDRLVAAGWLTTSSKIASYTTDTTENRLAVSRALQPALQAHGLSIAERAFASSGNQAGSIASRLKNAKVDRVIPVLASPLALMQAASAQQFTPRYALYSALGPGALLESKAPKDQLAGSYGIGWQPYLDIGTGSHPRPVSKNETLCFALMHAAGQASTTPLASALQVSLCNVVLYLGQAAATVGSVPPDLLDQAARRLGVSFPPADTFRINMSGRHDGAAGFRPLLFKGDCSCFQYLGVVRFTR